MQPSTELFSNLMRHALEQARIGGHAGEVPVGAVVAIGDKIISSAHNLVEVNTDPSAHAEILAIRSAATVLNNWRLAEAVLCVTLEPCPMCIGAIRLARIPTLIFAARDPRMGAVGSLFDLGNDSRLGPPPRIVEGICEAESTELLSKFFSGLRKLPADKK